MKKRETVDVRVKSVDVVGEEFFFAIMVGGPKHGKKYKTLTPYLKFPIEPDGPPMANPNPPSRHYKLDYIEYKDTRLKTSEGHHIFAILP